MVHYANADMTCAGSADVERVGIGDADGTVAPSATAGCLSADLADVAELEGLGDSIAELAAHVHAATYRLLVMLAEFDRRGGWSGGFRSCAHWLSWRTRIDLGAAREKVRVARALERLPQLSDALRRGELSYAVVRAVTRIATPANESELLDLARHGTASHVERVVRAWRRVDRLEEQWAEGERRRARSLQLYPDHDGMFILRGRLTPEVGALLERALAAAHETLYARPKHGEPAVMEISYAQRQADAIGLLAEWALGGDAAESNKPTDEAAGAVDGRTLERETETTNGQPEHAVATVTIAKLADEAAVACEECEVEATQLTSDALAVPPDKPAQSSPRQRRASISRAERFQVVVHVDAEALRGGSRSGQAVLAGGIRISAETCRRIACDASRVVMIHDKDGNVLDVGRRSRVLPTPIRRALEYRDQGCRFPGCDRRICDAHHIRHWTDGGKTKLSNLLMLCRYHHTLVHEYGFGVHMSAEGEISFTRPDGRPLPDAPQAPLLAVDCVDQLIAAHHDLDLEIDAWTPTPDWHGERLDMDFAIRALRALQQTDIATDESHKLRGFLPAVVG